VIGNIGGKNLVWFVADLQGRVEWSVESGDWLSGYWIDVAMYGGRFFSRIDKIVGCAR